MSHNWPLTGQGQQRPPKLKGRFRKAKPSQRTRNLTKFLQRYYPEKNERERKKNIGEPLRPGLCRCGRPGRWQPGGGGPRCGSGAPGVALRGCARPGGDSPRVPPGRRMRVLQREGAGVRGRDAGSGRAPPEPAVRPLRPLRFLNRPTPTAARAASSGLLGSESGQVAPV